MNWDTAFMAANTVALWGWVILIAAPRRPWLTTAASLWIPLLVSLAYTVTIAINLPYIEGGYLSLDGVRHLARNDGVLVAGWMHVVAFDLFVGGWAARRMDDAGLNRWLQAPVLLAIFLAGPFGFLVAAALTQRLRPSSMVKT